MPAATARGLAEEYRYLRPSIQRFPAGRQQVRSWGGMRACRGMGQLCRGSYGARQVFHADSDPGRRRWRVMLASPGLSTTH